MDIFLPKGFEAGLAQPRKSHVIGATKLSVKVGQARYPVLRRWATGFAVSAGDVPVLNGVVNLFDGSDHLHQCLITGKDNSNDEILFTIKRENTVDYGAVTEVEVGLFGTSSR